MDRGWDILEWIEHHPGTAAWVGAVGTIVAILARKMRRLGRISHKVLIFSGIKLATQISDVFAEPHWPAQPAMIGYTL